MGQCSGAVQGGLNVICRKSSRRLKEATFCLQPKGNKLRTRHGISCLEQWAGGLLGWGGRGAAALRPAHGASWAGERGGQPTCTAPFIRPLHFADTDHLCQQGPGPSWGHRERRQNVPPTPNHTALHHHTSLPPSKPDRRAKPWPEGRRQRPRGKNGPETRQQVSKDTQPLKIPSGGRRKKDRIARDRTQVRVTTHLWAFKIGQDEKGGPPGLARPAGMRT